MCARWEALRQGLVRSISTLKADHEFKTAGREEETLQRFNGPDALVAYLNQSGGDLDEKDRIYAALVRAVQSRSEWAELALALLSLGLWPGLDAVYRRRLRDFAEWPDELVAEIGAILATTVAHIDLSGVNRLAATLVRNVERDVRDGLRRRWRDQDRATDLATLEDRLRTRAPRAADSRLGGANDRAALEELLRAKARLLADRQLPVDARDTAAVREWLYSVVGDDADLVIGVALYGLDQKELAGQLGIRHDAARKRLQRAVKRIRESTDGERKPVPPGYPKARLDGGRQAAAGCGVVHRDDGGHQKPARMRLVTREQQHGRP